jgi:hypothetical protein
MTWTTVLGKYPRMSPSHRATLGAEAPRLAERRLLRSPDPDPDPGPSPEP